MNFKTNIKVIDFIQWLAFIGIVLGRYAEVIALVVIQLIIIAKNEKVKNLSRPIISLFLLLMHSSVLIYFYNYSFNKFIQQYLLISICILCYFQFFAACKYDTETLFNRYIQVMYFLCILGLIQFIVCLFLQIDIFPITLDGFIQSSPSGRFIRVHSILGESGNLGTCLVPIVAFILFDRYFYTQNKQKSIIIFTTFLLTLATISYVLLIVLLIVKLYTKVKFLKYLYISLIILLIPFSINLMTKALQDKEIGNEDFFSVIQNKIVQTSVVFSKIDSPESFEAANPSTYALLTNFWISANAPGRIIGTGLGTHQENYQHIYPPNDYYLYGLNSDDGYSLFNRIFSEFGVLGLFIYLTFLIKYSNFSNIINFCVFFLLMALLIRGGHYTLYGTIFFHFIFIYTSQKFNDYSCSKKS